MTAELPTDISLHVPGDDYSTLSGGGAAPGLTRLYPLPKNHIPWGQVNALIVPQKPGVQANVIGNQTLYVSDQYEEAVDWHIDLQASAGVGIFAGLSSQNFPVITLTYSEGINQIVKTFRLTSNANREIHVNSRYVQLTASWYTLSYGSLSPIPVSIGIMVGGVVDRPLSKNVQTWGYTGSNGTNASQVQNISRNGYGAPGFMSAMQFTLTQMSSDAALYLMFFDSTAAPSANQTTGIIWISPPFTAALQWIAMGDEADPQITFSDGLYYALSSNPYQYVAAASACGGLLVYKVGQ